MAPKHGHESYGQYRKHLTKEHIFQTVIFQIVFQTVYVIPGIVHINNIPSETI